MPLNHCRIHTSLVAIAMLATLTACIVFPTRIGHENLLTADRLEFIVVGTSTKDQVTASMSAYLTTNSPDKAKVNVLPLKFRNDNWWLYSQTRKETRWGILTVDGGGGIAGDEDYRFVLIKFDSEGIVAELDFSSSEGNECNEKGICVGDTFRPQILAAVQEDRVAKHFSPPADRCGIYVYGIPFDSNALWKSIPVWLNGRNVGLIVDGRQYFHWELKPGTHRIAFTNARGAAVTQESITCTAGSFQVFELHTGGEFVFWESSRQTSIELRGFLAGQTAIRKRRLTSISS